MPDSSGYLEQTTLSANSQKYNKCLDLGWFRPKALDLVVSQFSQFIKARNPVPVCHMDDNPGTGIAIG
jgi:hypothetical protein